MMNTEVITMQKTYDKMNTDKNIYIQCKNILYSFCFPVTVRKFGECWSQTCKCVSMSWLHNCEEHLSGTLLMCTCNEQVNTKERNNVL